MKFFLRVFLIVCVVATVANLAFFLIALMQGGHGDIVLFCFLGTLTGAFATYNAVQAIDHWDTM